MQNSKYISIKERILILVFSFLAFAFFAAAVGAEVVEFYNDQIFDAELKSKGISFSVDDGHRYSPGLFHVLTLVLFLTLLKTERFVGSIIVTIFYAAFFAAGILARLDRSGALGSEDFYSNRWLEFSNKTGVYDYVAAFFIVILLVWQISIILRIKPWRSPDFSQLK